MIEKVRKRDFQVNRPKKENHMIISIDSGKAFANSNNHS